MEGSWAMALIRPDWCGPFPERAAPRRGARAATACPAMPQTACLHAVVAAARRTPVRLFPGSGIDRHVPVRAAHDPAGHAVIRVCAGRVRRTLTTRAGRGGRP
ncbi:hypothetical protein [Streptomyces sp. B8F3]|uniref:hypothetical protein n=1 Tax=unclassified Streptomyces TaxID=2593676 RepID=UPI00325D7E04